MARTERMFTEVQVRTAIRCVRCDRTSNKQYREGMNDALAQVLKALDIVPQGLGMCDWMKLGRAKGGGVLWTHLCGYQVVVSPGENPGSCGGCK
jgi:hypothetical protein